MSRNHQAPSGSNKMALRAAFLAGAMLAGFTAMPTWAQDETPADQAEAVDEEQGEDIIVTGTRRSLEDALETKRQSVEVLDSISAEGIGKLPDLNLAESLQRLPGVQINRSAQRRGGTVSIRGLPGDFSQTLINGQYLASPSVSNFSFGNVRSEVFSAIDVQKASNSAFLSGGLSGLVNLRTGDPLSSQDQLSVNVDGRYEELQDAFAPGGGVVFSKQLIPGVLGVRLAAGYREDNFRADNLQINTYDRTAGAATADLSDDVYAPRQVRLPIQTVKGGTFSASGAVEWKPEDSLTVGVRGFYNDYRPKFYETQFLLEASATSTRTALNTLDEGAFGKTQDRIRVTNGRLLTDNRYTDVMRNTYAITGNVEWEKNGWRIEGVAHYTRAKRNEYVYGFQAVQAALTGGADNGLSFEIDTGSGDLGRAYYDLLTGTAAPNLNQAFGPLLSPTFRESRAVNQPGFSLLGGFRNSREYEDELAFSLNIDKELDFGPISKVAAGGVYRDKSQGQRNPLQTLFGVDVTKFDNRYYNFSLLDGGQPFLGGRIGGFDRAGYAEYDVEAFAAAISPSNPTGLPANSAIGPGGFVELTDSTAISDSYDNKQQIYGGFARIDLDQQLGDSLHLRGNAGIRYEKSERATISFNAANQPVDIGFEYDNWLPSANLTLEAFDNFVLRGAYSKTLRRPQVDSFAVLRSVAVDGVGSIISVNLGAGDLRPFTSDNFDIALEWYNRAGSSIAVTLFKKNVHDYAGTTRICPEDGGGFGFGTFTMASGVCRTTGVTPAGNGFPAVREGAQVTINVTANQDSFSLKGAEISIQQNLSFLPGFLKYFGGQLNYTYIDFASSSSFRLSEISQDTFNAIVYWESPDVSLRAAYNYRSTYFLGSGGTASGADRYVKARPQLDLSAQVNLTDRLSLSAEVFNVTNTELYEYEGAETRARNYFVYGRTVSFGASYRF